MDIQKGNLREGHLTDEQFSELLMGATPAPVQEHLRVCAACATEADRAAGAIGSFEQQSRLWAECRAASRPALSAEQQPSFAWASIFARPQAWAAAALAVAVGIGVTISTHHQQTQQIDIAARQTAPSIAPAQEQTAQMEKRPVTSPSPRAHVTPSKLKSDNELLSAIDGELRADATPENLYGLSVSSQRHNSGRMAN